MTADRAYFLLARSENPPPDTPGGRGRYHTVPPRGEYPSVIHLRDGRKEDGVLVVDDAAYSKILAAFSAAAAQPGFPGLLVDREHASELPEGDTIAAAWAKTMEQRDDGLWTGWDLTSLGTELLAGPYKFRSPVFNLEKLPACAAAAGRPGSGSRYRPVELVSIGLTNKPHFKNLAPSLNKDGGTTEKENEMALLEKIRALLKLGDTSSEDDAITALGKALAKAETDSAELATVKARADGLEKAALDRDAAEFVSKHGARFGDEAKLKALFIGDRKAAEELVALLKPPAAPQTRTLHREDGKTPDKGTDAEKTRAREQQLFVGQVRAREGEDRCTFARAWAIAEKEKPELFTPAN